MWHLPFQVMHITVLKLVVLHFVYLHRKYSYRSGCPLMSMQIGRGERVPIIPSLPPSISILPATHSDLKGSRKWINYLLILLLDQFLQTQMCRTSSLLYKTVQMKVLLHSLCPFKSNGNPQLKQLHIEYGKWLLFLKSLPLRTVIAFIEIFFSLNSV